MATRGAVRRVKASYAVTDTIFALSSGLPPAAIGVIRVSGPSARSALQALAGDVPAPRHAALRNLQAASGETLDQALVLWLPGPGSPTGEDCVEFHCHGGRAVIAALRGALGALPGMREAEPGEFTRRAFLNGRLDLAQAEALGDLLSAETELQRRVAQAGVGGALSRLVAAWRDRVLSLSATVEGVLDFSDEADVTASLDCVLAQCAELRREILDCLAYPRAERLREGVRVVIGGPPNSGKSSLFNALIGENAAIVSPRAGTTRDFIERGVAIQGVPFVLVDTAGLREDDCDEIEANGIARAQAQLSQADIALWLGEQGAGPPGSVEVQARSDDRAARGKTAPDYVVSSKTGDGLSKLQQGLVERAAALLPQPGVNAVNDRQAALLTIAAEALGDSSADELVMAEALRGARVSFDRLLGHSGVEDMLDTLFSRFCIGK
jgi:tRNA modification GTPase